MIPKLCRSWQRCLLCLQQEIAQESLKDVYACTAADMIKCCLKEKCAAPLSVDELSVHREDLESSSVSSHEYNY